jgi:hypothetical protein
LTSSNSHSAGWTAAIEAAAGLGSKQQAIGTTSRHGDSSGDNCLPVGQQQQQQQSTWYLGSSGSSNAA